MRIDVKKLKEKHDVRRKDNEYLKINSEINSALIMNKANDYVLPYRLIALDRSRSDGEI